MNVQIQELGISSHGSWSLILPAIIEMREDDYYVVTMMGLLTVMACVLVVARVHLRTLL